MTDEQKYVVKDAAVWAIDECYELLEAASRPESEYDKAEVIKEIADAAELLMIALAQFRLDDVSAVFTERRISSDQPRKRQLKSTSERLRLLYAYVFVHDEDEDEIREILDAGALRAAKKIRKRRPVR